MASSPRFERVFLVRHGETEWNLTGRRQGQLDSRLTETGRGQAERIAALVASGEPDVVFTSPLGRAVSTAQLVGTSLALPIVIVDDLREIDHGTFAGMTNAEIDAAHPGALAHRALDKYAWRFPGGESYEDADQRARLVLDVILRAGSLRPLVVTHEMVGRMLLRALLDLSPADALARALPQGAVLVISPSLDGQAGQLERWG